MREKALMRKIAVIFPGLGYTKDRPLLYYAGKIAEAHGYERRALDFSSLRLTKDGLRDPARLEEAVDRCAGMAEALWADVALGCGKGISGSSSRVAVSVSSMSSAAEQSAKAGYGHDGESAERADIVFISKSIGTVAASLFAKRHGIAVRQIYFTPLEYIEHFAEADNGLVFYGDADPFANPREIARIAEALHLEAHCFANANHSLETGDVLDDIANLQKVMQIVENTFGK